MKKKPIKSISFFMELMIVIFFFTLAAGICVLVMSYAKEKSILADDIKKTLLYGQNMITQQNDILHNDHFQLNEDGQIVDEGIFDASINVIKKGAQGDLCELRIVKQQTDLANIKFYRLTNYHAE